MEYSRNFQDNIYPEEFNSRVDGINNWISENKELHEWAKDPNAYEMTNVFLFAGKYASEGEDIDLNSVKKMWDLRSGDFERCGISEKNFIYQICEQSYNKAMNGEALVNDEESHSALRKMAGIGLYLMQQQRDGQTVDYNNLHEFIGLLYDSKTLKQNYPDLHKNLRFEENISRLYTMQKEHLNEKEQVKLGKVYDSYMSVEQDQSDER